MIALETQACNGCGNCANICPHLVLEMQHKKAVITAEERCIECGACQLNCEEDALVVTKGTGCLFLIIKQDILGIGVEPSAGKAALEVHDAVDVDELAVKGVAVDDHV